MYFLPYFQISVPLFTNTCNDIDLEYPQMAYIKKPLKFYQRLSQRRKTRRLFPSIVTEVFAIMVQISLVSLYFRFIMRSYLRVAILNGAVPLSLVIGKLALIMADVFAILVPILSHTCNWCNCKCCEH